MSQKGGSLFASCNLKLVRAILNQTSPYVPCIRVDHLLEKYYLPTFYSVEFILGVIANGIVLCSFMCGIKKWSTSSIYLFNLCLSDFAFLCTLPILVKSYAQDNWTYGDVWCQFNRFLLHANLYTSILFLACISMDRYMMIQHPFKEHVLQSTRPAIFISIAVWILVTLELLPMLTFIGPQSLYNSTQCKSYASSGDAGQSLIYSTILTFFGFIIPLCTICCFYFRIVMLLRDRSTLLGPPLEKPLRLVILAIILFSMFFTPYHIMRNIRIASRMESWNMSHCTKGAINAIYIITRPIAFLNSVVNPIFYFLIGGHFREELMSKIRNVSKKMNMYST